MNYKLILIALVLVAYGVVCNAAVYDVRDFGALGDGQHIDSDAINEAIQRAADDGGGTVVVCQGVFLCYSIHLRSNITLKIEEGAIIKAAPVTTERHYDESEDNDFTQYQDFGHSHWHNSLIWGEDISNITIEGKGMIDGEGVLTRGGGSRQRHSNGTANKALAMKCCKDVTIRDISLHACGHFAMLLTGVDNLLIEDVTADTNRDGFDIDCCEKVVIRNCRVNTVNDDAIVLKASYALGYPKPTRNVLIEDCHVSGYDVGTLLDGTCQKTTTKAPDGDGPTGRIKLGTESNGGFSNITIRRCTFNHCRGLALETVDGAYMKNINVSDIRMDDICNSPIYIRLGDRMRAPKGFHASKIRNINLRNIYVTNADSRYASIIAGIKGNPIKKVRITDVYIQYRGGITLDDVKHQRGSNPFFFGKGGGAAAINRHEGTGGYPEPSAHGIQPAWGFSITNTEDITLKNVRLETITPDERPMFYIENTKGFQSKK